MTNKIKISNLRKLDKSDIRSINSDRIVFITAQPNDLRTKGLLEEVNKSHDDIEVIDTDIIKKSYIEYTPSEDSLTVVVDTSLIKRSCLAGIFNEIYQIAEHQHLNLYIYYSLGKYIEPNNDQLHPNKRVSSVHPRFMGWDEEQDLNVMAIVGLGYEKDKAVGAVEYLESLRTVVFIPNSSESAYLEEVKNQNEHLISSTNKNDQIFYDVENPVRTLLKIDSVLAGCYQKYKPVLLPFGPKIFYACSLLAAMAHPNASVWYVSGEESERKKVNQLPVSTFGIGSSIGF